MTDPAAMPSSLERAFETQWLRLAPESVALIAEYHFDPERGWRFDFAHPQTRVAVELEGGAGTGGRHTRYTGFMRDCEKYNKAAELGWCVLRYTGAMLRDDPQAVIDQVVLVIEGRMK